MRRASTSHAVARQRHSSQSGGLLYPSRKKVAFALNKLAQSVKRSRETPKKRLTRKVRPRQSHPHTLRTLR
jgi:hypothetical protein